MLINSKYQFWQAKGEDYLDFAWIGTLNERQVLIATDGFIFACVPIEMDEDDIPGPFIVDSQVIEAVIYDAVMDSCPECDDGEYRYDRDYQISLTESVSVFGYHWNRGVFAKLPKLEEFINKLNILSDEITLTSQKFAIDTELLHRLGLALGTAKIQLRITKPEAPILVKPRGDSKWLTPPFGVIMPMKLNWPND